MTRRTPHYEPPYLISMILVAHFIGQLRPFALRAIDDGSFALCTLTVVHAGIEGAVQFIVDDDENDKSEGSSLPTFSVKSHEIQRDMFDATARFSVRGGLISKIAFAVDI